MLRSKKFLKTEISIKRSLHGKDPCVSSAVIFGLHMKNPKRGVLENFSYPFRSEHIIISETKVYNVSAARVQQTVTIYALAGGNT
jgi:hypothetical protein